MNISGVILAKNEEKNIKRSIESVNFCDEIIVIDDDSTDKTAQIAKKLGAKVIKRPIRGDFAGQRNYAMTQASNDWILFIDADETVTEELKKEIISLDSRLRGNDIYPEAYYLKRRDFWWGRELKFGETQKVRNKGIIRLVRKNSGEWMGDVHEVFYTPTSTGSINAFLNHYPHPTIKDFLNDINVYSSLRARELYNYGKTSNILEIVFFPLFKFMLIYFFYLGFLDGTPGFIYAFFMSFHSFLVRAKLYQYKFMKRET